MNYYAALDVSLRSVHLCVVDDGGELVAETKLSSEVTGIAQLLRTGWYNPVHIKSMASHQVRALLSSRRTVLDKCIDLENEIRGLFKIFGIKLPSKLGHGSFDTAVRGIIEADTTLSHSLLPLLDARLVLYHCFRELDNRTRHMAHADPVCQVLMSAPGVGFITALTYKSGVDDPHRFKHSRTVAAHFGLTPRRFQSGEIDIEEKRDPRQDATSNMP